LKLHSRAYLTGLSCGAIACPMPPRRAATFTDVANAGHDIWDPTYDLSGGSGDIYAWLLQNAKP
jgi:hypothetical protein